MSVPVSDVSGHHPNRHHRRCWTSAPAQKARDRVVGPCAAWSPTSTAAPEARASAPLIRRDGHSLIAKGVL